MCIFTKIDFMDSKCVGTWWKWAGQLYPMNAWGKEGAQQFREKTFVGGGGR